MSALKRPLFSYTTEDFKVLETALPPENRSRVLCISSGGETMLNLIALGASEIVVVDSEFSQLALARLKLAGMRQLPQEDFKALLGLPSKSIRPIAFDAIRKTLSNEDQRYWDESGFLNDGALWCGSLARYLAIGRGLLKCVLGTRRLNQLAANDHSDGPILVSEMLLLWRVRLLLWIILHPFILERFYPKKGWESLSSSRTPRDFCLEKVKCALTKVPVADNPVIYPYLFGQLPRKLWPPYIEAKKSVAKSTTVDFWKGDLREVADFNSQNPYTGFSLCNVIDWLGRQAMRSLLEELRDLAVPGAKLLMYSRDHSIEEGKNLQSGSWSFQHTQSENLTRADRTGYHTAVFLLEAR